MQSTSEPPSPDMEFVHAPNRRRNAAEIAAEIRTQIINGQWSKLERLPSERNLAQQFGTSRGTVREALLRLEKEKLVEIRASSGTYVNFDPDQQVNKFVANARPLELIDARFALEPHICRLAVLHGQRTDFSEMERLLRLMETCVENPIHFAEFDAEFHLALVKSTGNSLLVWIISQINTVRSEKRWNQMRELTLNRQTICSYNGQHRQILDAIRARKPEQAARHMKDHLQTARLSLIRMTEG